MSNLTELAIIGTGPAGMAAAIAAREHGIDVLVLDEQAAPGGQIYRNVETVTAERPDAARVLGEDYTAGGALARAFRECGAGYSPGTSVWEVSTVARREDGNAPLELGVLRNGIAEIMRASCVIVATGAQERAVPVSGATLPGVMGAGGAQSLLKGSGLVPDVPVVIAGSGPLVYLVAWQLVCAGAPVRALLLTTPPGRIWRAIGTLPEALAMPGALRKGIGWRRALASRGVEVVHVSGFAIEGSERVESVRFEHRGRERSIDASLVLLHEGVIPSVHLTLAGAARSHLGWSPARLSAGCGRVGNDERAPSAGRGRRRTYSRRGGGGGFRPDGGVRSGAPSRKGIDLQRRDVLARPHRVSLSRHRRFREFLDLAFEPGAAALRPSDPAVTVCRCEEVTVAEIERVITHGCPGPNQAKAFTRCGMGPCQGRMCATAVSEMFAERRHAGVGAIGHYGIRPPVKPLTLGELAALEGTGTAPADRASTPIRPKGSPT